MCDGDILTGFCSFRASKAAICCSKISRGLGSTCPPFLGLRGGGGGKLMGPGDGSYPSSFSVFGSEYISSDLISGMVWVIKGGEGRGLD